MGPAVLACESCINFSIDERQPVLAIALIALAVAATLGSLLLLVRALRRHGRGRIGPLLMALGLLLVPVSMIPVVQRHALRQTTTAQTPLGERTSTVDVFCEKALYASWNYDREMTTPQGLAAQDACRHDATRSGMMSSSILLAAIGIVAVGAFVGRAGRGGAADGVSARGWAATPSRVRSRSGPTWRPRSPRPIRGSG